MCAYFFSPKRNCILKADYKVLRTRQIINCNMRQANPLVPLTGGFKTVGGCIGHNMLSIPESMPVFLCFLFSGERAVIAKNGPRLFHAYMIAG
jgi:hypothetical protein